jgi:hypothetical protein
LEIDFCTLVDGLGSGVGLALQQGSKHDVFTSMTKGKNMLVVLP